jgi:hypothetical protein
VKTKEAIKHELDNHMVALELLGMIRSKPSIQVTKSRNKREGKFLKGRRNMRTYYAKLSTKARKRNYGQFKEAICNCGQEH